MTDKCKWVMNRLRALTPLLIGILLMGASCEEGTIDGCDVSNPAEDLDWMQSLIANFELSQQATGIRIESYTFNDEEVYLVNTCVGCSDNLLSVYNCQGEIICEFGGIDGRDTCGDFYENVSSKQFIYSNTCGSITVVDDIRYGESSDFFFLNSAAISGDCLHVNYSASGCSGNSWEIELVASTDVMESLPVQRNIKLILENQEACQAIFQRDIYFDLTPLQISDYGDMYLNLDGLDDQLYYKYSTDVEFISDKLWTLTKVDGGMLPVEYNFSSGNIKWNFGDNEVVIVNNNNDDEKEDFFESGTYSFGMVSQPTSGFSMTVDGKNMGYFSKQSEGEFWLDGRAYDGLRLIFKALN